jgi:transaldolase
MYGKVMEAYIKGLERRAEAGQPVNGIASVASFFVSRVDTLVDKLLDNKIAAGGAQAELDALKGKAANANAKLAYQLFKKTFFTPRFEALEAKGARVQRPLWASTSTKNPDYPDTLYVDPLIGPNTINTAPPHTIEAFRDHGVVAVTIEDGVDEAKAALDALEQLDIYMPDVTTQLLNEGVAKFEVPFNALLEAVETKRQQFAG